MEQEEMEREEMDLMLKMKLIPLVVRKNDRVVSESDDGGASLDKPEKLTAK